MLRKIVITISVLIIAFGILFASLLRTAAVRYEFNPTHTHVYGGVLGETSQVDYYLPYQGGVLPGSPLWPIKVIRDKFWLLITTNPSRKAEILLLFADKRVAASEILFEQDNPDEGYSTLTKAEKYLQEAANQEASNRKSGIDTTDFLTRLANASLKHAEVIYHIISIAPDDAKPKLEETLQYSKGIYWNSSNLLLDKHVEPPKNPFGWK